MGLLRGVSGRVLFWHRPGDKRHTQLIAKEIICEGGPKYGKMNLKGKSEKRGGAKKEENAILDSRTTK